MPKNKTKKILENGFVKIKKCRHGYFAYNKNDLFVGKSLDIYGEWCEKELNLLGNFIQSGDIVLDIGAYIGTHSVFFAKKTEPSGLVFAFEPQRIPFQILNANIALNNLLNVISINRFVSDKKEVKQIPILNPFVKQNFGAFKLSLFDQGEKIESLTIDEMNLPRCALIKIDTEEGEEKILKGAKETIKRCLPVIYVENNEIEDSGKIIKAVFSLGYKCYWHIFPYFNPKNFFKNKNNVFSAFSPEANMLCLPKELEKNFPKLPEVKGINDNWRKALDRM
jgi:FkbM family methyltransferase